MKDLKKIVFGAFAVVAVLFSVSTAHAQAAYSTTTAASNVNGLINDVGSAFGLIIVVILAFLAALIGLGMGVRYFKRWIGRK